MRRPTIRLGYVMELVVAAAVCLAVVRSQWPSATPFGTTPTAADRVRLVGGSLLTGLALAGAGGLVMGTVRGRTPSSWGLGRWIWAIAGFFMLFEMADQFAVISIFAFSSWSTGINWRLMLSSLPVRCAVHQFFGGFGWAVAAVCATSMLSRTPRDAEPDAREWAGRVFASLAVALNIAERLLRVAGR